MCRRQLEVVMTKLGQKGVTPGVVSDCMVRVVYMHLLGYDCSPVFIHCVKMAGKMGTLACCLMIPPTHQLALLVTNSILTDLASKNIVDIRLGLLRQLIVKPPMGQLLLISSERVIGPSECVRCHKT